MIGSWLCYWALAAFIQKLLISVRILISYSEHELTRFYYNISIAIRFSWAKWIWLYYQFEYECITNLETHLLALFHIILINNCKEKEWIIIILPINHFDKKKSWWFTTAITLLTWLRRHHMPPWASNQSLAITCTHHPTSNQSIRHFCMAHSYF